MYHQQQVPQQQQQQPQQQQTETAFPGMTAIGGAGGQFPTLSYDKHIVAGEKLMGTVVAIRHYPSKYPQVDPTTGATTRPMVTLVAFTLESAEINGSLVPGQVYAVNLTAAKRQDFVDANVGINDKFGLHYKGKKPNPQGAGNFNDIDLAFVEAANSQKVASPGASVPMTGTAAAAPQGGAPVVPATAPVAPAAPAMQPAAAPVAPAAPAMQPAAVAPTMPQGAAPVAPPITHVDTTSSIPF